MSNSMAAGAHVALAIGVAAAFGCLVWILFIWVLFGWFEHRPRG